jgi:leucyl-tRNA synthetase
MFKRDYNFHEIEEKWQKYWDEKKTFKSSFDSSKPKYYILDMFPYPSGQGLHVGHPKGYVGSDVISRYKRMRGFNVLHPMGWDAFGLPTERQAAKENIHPALITQRNVDTFRKQLKLIGLSYDWDRELSTSYENYYKWTQWIFLKLFERGLAYQSEVAVNWCPALGTVLSNEEVKDGFYVETGDPVEKRLMKQWMLKITAYADRLTEDLADLDWPESVKEMQRNWIGKSEGASVKFKVADSDKEIEVFTTRPDTLFGCSYVVLAPEHQLVKQIMSTEQKEIVEEYIEKTQKLSERDRIAGAEKTGVFIGAYAVCPVNNKKVQIWISDYVLANYGTGAVFACPAHDERDYEFATKFGLDIIEVVKGGNISEKAYTEDGEHINSEFLDGLTINDAKKKVISWLEENNSGKAEINYKLRDWLFSRQRYWGEPFPVLIDPIDGSVHAVPEEQLPVLLPHLDNITPTPDGRPPLARAEEWGKYTDPKTGKEYIRETNTMPQWAGSCWYYLRFIDPNNDKNPWDTDLEKAWMPVDLYIGGTEHATLHLLYARFWHKVLYDMGLVSTKEPFQKLFNQGLIQAQSYQDDKGKYYYPREVYEKDGKWYSKDSDLLLKTKVEKMSKSRCNVTTPDEVIENYGADSLRLYELFIGPLEDGAVWQTDNITGVKRLLDRLWNLFTEERLERDETKPLDKKLELLTHQTIKKITEDLEQLHLNTSISQFMIFVNELYKIEKVPTQVLNVFLKLIAPFAPHIAEELWERMGNTDSIAYAEWPTFDPAKTIEDTIEIPVQVGGKLKGTVTVQRDAEESVIKEEAVKLDGVARALDGKTIVKVIYVKNKIFNLIVK